MKYILGVWTILAAMVLPAAAAVPDFAYPQTVIETSQANIDAALEAHNDSLLVGSVMQYALAESNISNDNIGAIIAKIDSVANIVATYEKSSAACVLHSVKAQVYARFFAVNRYKFNSRTNSVEPRPADINEWSADQIKDEIARQLDLSLASKDALEALPVSEYASVMEYNAYGADICPNMYAMLLNRAIGIMEETVYGKSSRYLTSMMDYAASSNNEFATLYYTAANPTLQPYANKFINYYTSWKQFYDKYTGTQYCGLLIRTVDVGRLSNEEKLDFYEFVCRFMERYPDYPFMNEVENVKNTLTERRVSANISKTVPAGKGIRVAVQYSNVNAYTLTVYKRPAGKDNYKISDCQLMHMVRSDVAESVPFYEVTDTVLLPSLKYGKYLLVVSTERDDKTVQGYRAEFAVSDLAIYCLTSSDSEEISAVVVEGTTGAPVSGATVTCTDPRNDDKVISTRRTNAQGIAVFNNKSQRCDFAVTKGADKYCDKLSVYAASRRYADNEAIHAGVFTNLAIYRPGDVLKFAAVLYRNDAQTKNRTLAEDVECNAVLVNSSGSEVDTLMLRSDNWGRISGDFHLPQSGMNGRYTVRVTAKASGRTVGSKSVQVAEYKTPGFYVELTDAKSQYSAAADSIVLTGKAVTYSSVPVANARVTMKLNLQHFLWGVFLRGEEQYLLDEETTTGSNGEFTFTLCKSEMDVLMDSLNIRGMGYGAEFSVVSPSGETQSVRHDFTLGPAIQFKIDPDASIIATTKSSLPVEVTGNGDVTGVRVKYTFTDAQGTVKASGIFVAGDNVADLTKLPSGPYTLKFTLESDTSITMLANNIVVYRPDEKKSPIAADLWLPTATVAQQQNGDVQFIAASNTPSYIYYVAYDNKGLIDKNWMHLEAGQSQVNINLPVNGSNNMEIWLYVVKNGNLRNKKITVKPYINSNPVEVTVETFRDKVSAGDEEHWKFTVTGGVTPNSSAAMILNVYNAALDAIAPNIMRFEPVSTGNYYMGVTFNYARDSRTALSWSNKNTYKVRAIELPQFATYGATMFGGGIMRKMYRTVSTADSGAEIVEAEVATFGEVAYATAEAKMDANMIVGYAPAKGVDFSEVQLREGELNSALWLPMIVTDTVSGTAVVEFSVPNYNTTWQLDALAYTRSVEAATKRLKMVASKPVMVQPNLPRFLRTGDDATVTSMVINNSGEEATVKVRIEMYNPMDNVSIYSADTTLVLAPYASAPVAVALNVPGNISLIGYRIRAINEKYSDGEQNVIPVLTDISPVTESKIFMLNPNQDSTMIYVPKQAKGASVNLIYCNNPAWECITALPDIFDGTPVAATGKAANLFAAIVSQGLLRQNPTIGEALRYWEVNPGDSALVSMLAKNGKLKIGDIQNSPWLTASARQTLQMQAVAMLADTVRVAARIEELAAGLVALQNSNGSISWIENCNGSYYVTLRVLERIGEAMEMSGAAMPDALQPVVEKALKYIDTQIMEMYEKQGNKKDRTLFVPYAYVRSMYPKYPQSEEIKQHVSAALTYVARNWRSASLENKAYAAILLARYGEVDVAKNIVKSISQFAINTPDRGAYFDAVGGSAWGMCSNRLPATALVLRALHAVTPASPLVDKLRQWILVDKQLSDWNSESDAVDAVYAIATTGTPWLYSADKAPKIMMGGMPLQYGKVAAYTGAVNVNIDSCKPGERIEIVREPGTPAWGALLMRYEAPAKTVKAASAGGLSITKSFYDMAGNQLHDLKQFSVGDKVRVMLVVKARQDMDYVMIHDERASAMEPVDQLSTYTAVNGVWMYREIKDSAVNMFIGYLPKGVHTLYYDVTITAPGTYGAGIATAQSQYAPQYVAHSAGVTLEVK